jgi:hypothetical protein
MSDKLRNFFHNKVTKVLHAHISNQKVSINDLGRAKSCVFDHCDNCRIVINCKINHLEINNCRNVQVVISAALVSGLEINNSANVTVTDQDYYSFNINIYNSNAILLDVYSGFRVEVETSNNVEMNGVLLSIADYTVWCCD